MGSRMVLRGGGVGILKLIFVWNLGNDWAFEGEKYLESFISFKNVRMKVLK